LKKGKLRGIDRKELRVIERKDQKQMRNCGKLSDCGQIVCKMNVDDV
jgi:hypothetical protein